MYLPVGGEEGEEEEERRGEEGEEEETGQAAGSAQEAQQLVHDLDERDQGQHQGRQPGNVHRRDRQEGRRAVEGTGG